MSRKIEITKINDMIFVEGNKCSLCGDRIVKGHFESPFCSNDENIKNAETIVLDIDNTLDMTKIFEGSDLMFEVHTRTTNGEDIACICLGDEIIWNENDLI